MPQTGKALFQLVDLNGKMVMEQQFNSHYQPALIELGGVSSGFYTWKIVFQNQVSSGKIEMR